MTVAHDYAQLLTTLTGLVKRFEEVCRGGIGGITPEDQDRIENAKRVIKEAKKTAGLGT